MSMYMTSLSGPSTIGQDIWKHLESAVWIVESAAQLRQKADESRQNAVAFSNTLRDMVVPGTVRLSRQRRDP